MEEIPPKNWVKPAHNVCPAYAHTGKQRHEPTPGASLVVIKNGGTGEGSELRMYLCRHCSAVFVEWP